MSDNTKKIIRFSISSILIIVSVWYATRDINFTNLWHILLNADYLWVLLSIPVILLSHWIRAMRWKTMLEPALKVKSASTWNLFSAVMIGYLFNCVLPRGGELIRPYVYARREKVSFTSTFATIIVERVIDVIILVLLFAFVFFFLSDQIVQAFEEKVDVVKVIYVTGMILFVVIASFYPPVFRFLIRIVLKPISKNFYDKISQLFEKFLKGFAIIKSPSKYLQLSFESFAIWFCYTVPMYLMFFSFNLHTTANLGFSDAILLIVISGIGTTIAPTPGAVGIYHYLIQTAMVMLYGMQKEEALAYATLTHGVNYLIQVIVGGLFFMRENVKKIPLNEVELPKDSLNGT
ncbi:MAG: lysylphosphatidylglycerol synthase transmembrane domain-containing protein [bacterium]